MSIPRCAVSSVALWLWLAPSWAQAPLDEIVVAGEYPGPGLWKVTRADDAAGHVMWIVSDPPPLPERMQWKSKEVEALALQSQEILRDSTVRLVSDEKIGWLRKISLVPAVLKARRNPGEAELREVVPPDVYARWLVQKKLYLGRESGVENWRPLFAADKLRQAALDDLKLREMGAVWAVLGPLAEKQKIRVNTPNVRLLIKRSELRATIKEFSRESLADLECFATTLEMTEALADRQTQSARATAWATGDHEALARLPMLPNPRFACAMAMLNAQVAREIVPQELGEQVVTVWLDAAERSLSSNQTTLAVVPFVKLTRSEGYLDRLRAKGYLIEAPH